MLSSGISLDSCVSPCRPVDSLSNAYRKVRIARSSLSEIENQFSARPGKSSFLAMAGTHQSHHQHQHQQQHHHNLDRDVAGAVGSGDNELFYLKWHNFQKNVSKQFERLREDDDLVDITFACDGKQIRAHKLVLFACSPYFKQLLKVNCWRLKRIVGRGAQRKFIASELTVLIDYHQGNRE